MKRVAQVLIVCCGLVLLMGAEGDNARYEAVGGKLMCTCGCDQMLLKCNHVGCPNSAKMIAQLRENLAKSSSDDDVLNFFRRTWGITTVVEPSRHGFELLAWVLPFAGLGLGMGMVALVVSKWKSRAQEVKKTSTTDPHLEELRERARKETEE